MTDRKRIENTALIGLTAQAVFVVICLVLAARSGSAALGAETWHLTVGLAIWLLVLFHGRMRRLAEEQREEREALRVARLSEEIFEETELDTASAAAMLRAFEKYVVPIASVVLAGVMIYLAYVSGWRVLSPEGGVEPEALEPAATAAAAVGMIFVAFAGFLVGKYAAGLSQTRGLELLRAAGAYVMGNVIACVLVIVAMGLYYFDVKWPERAVAVAIPVLMLLVALEMLLNLVLDIYRPRVEGRESRPPYDSRLLGLFAEPGGVLKTVAATLDYQFGFKVSETWFYGFMARAIVPLALVQVVTLWLLTCIVVVKQEEIVFIEKLGVPYVTARDKAAGRKATVFEAGFYLKAPWPFAVARHVPGYRVHRVELGKVYSEAALKELMLEKHEDSDMLLWSERHIDRKHGEHASFMMPGRRTVNMRMPENEAPERAAPAVEKDNAAKVPLVNLAQLLAHLHYRVKRVPETGLIDPQAAYDYYYRQSNIQEHVDLVAYRALCRVAASQDLLRWMAEDRGVAIARLQQLIQETFDGSSLGLEVTFAGMTTIHPPYEVHRSYEAVMGALQTRETLRLQGEIAATSLAYAARSEAANIKNSAARQAYLTSNMAAAEADLFKAQLAVCRVGQQDPKTRDKVQEVFLYRTYCDAVETALPGHKVYVVPVTANEVNIIDLEEKLRPGLAEGLAVAPSEE